MEHIRTAKESGFLFDWSSGWLASDEVAREIQPVKNERKVFPTVENVNDLGARKTLVSKKAPPRVRTRAVATILKSKLGEPVQLF
jgi:hypothetical protein